MSFIEGEGAVDGTEIVRRTSVDEEDSEIGSSTLDRIEKDEITISVGEPVQHGSYLSKFMAYPVTVSGNEPVYRRFREFVQLRVALLKMCPGLFIPGLPPKKLEHNVEQVMGLQTDKSFLEDRRKMMETFLILLNENEIISNDPLFRDFLSWENADVTRSRGNSLAGPQDTEDAKGSAETSGASVAANPAETVLILKKYSSLFSDLCGVPLTQEVAYACDKVERTVDEILSSVTLLSKNAKAYSGSNKNYHLALHKYNQCLQEISHADDARPAALPAPGNRKYILDVFEKSEELLENISVKAWESFAEAMIKQKEDMQAMKDVLTQRAVLVKAVTAAEEVMEAWARKEASPGEETPASPASPKKEGGTLSSWTAKFSKKMSEAKIVAKTKMASKDISPEELKKKDQDRLDSLKQLLAVISLVILKVTLPSFWAEKNREYATAMTILAESMEQYYSEEQHIWESIMDATEDTEEPGVAPVG